MVLLSLMCFRCKRTPSEIPLYVTFARAEGITADKYVLHAEGTLNENNGHFACDDCYIAIGMPTASGRGWKAP